MESQKTIKLYVYVDGINDIPFYGVAYKDFVLANGETFTTKDGFVFNVRQTNEQIEIGSFRYDAKRMGGAPTISFTLMYEECLDNFWSDKVYAVFNGEKYFLKQTPTSSLSNEDARYKHEVELISARAILDNVLVYDAIVGDPEEAEKPLSNSTQFTFFGRIDEFAKRLNSSLEYAKLQKKNEDGTISGYRVVVDEGITSEAMLVSFSDAYFSNAIQESYNTYKVPYYFVGEEIHFGNSNGAIAKEFSYGVDNALLSITKTNANNKVVNRVTGVGSSENLPYYYPNNSPKGDIQVVATPSTLDIKVLDNEKFANIFDVNKVIVYEQTDIEITNVKRGLSESYHLGDDLGPSYFTYKGFWEDFTMDVSSSKENAKIKVIAEVNFTNRTTGEHVDSKVLVRADFDGEEIFAKRLNAGEPFDLILPFGRDINQEKKLKIDFSYSIAYTNTTDTYTGWFSLNIEKKGQGVWYLDGKEVDLKDFGLVYNGGELVDGATITQESGKIIKPSATLLPPIYRETEGAERFYNALNDTYDDGNGGYISFPNPYTEGQPKEYIIKIDDIKPTIKEAVNAQGLRIDMFRDFAYDEDDNDETYIDEEGETYFKHPYFFGRLRKMDFNLFDSANEKREMTISFTSGNCGACNFVIGATEDYPQKNPVQVDSSGNLIYKDGQVWCGLEGVEGQAVYEYQDRQQDTQNYEVWIALKKEEETYGTLMPSKFIRPKACSSSTANDGDTFVITGINLPQSYITKAEEKLEAEIIKYMRENNEEKFNFSINFSRIYFEENPDVLELLNENASLYIWYNNRRYTLYVSSISYSMGEGDVLPDIRVDLVDTLAVSQNAIQSAISQVKADMGNALANLDILTATTPYFIRKDQDDEVQGRINFKKGIKFGEGGRVDLLDDNSAKLTIEYLEVTKKATFTSLEIQEKTHVGGQMLITPAAMNCGEVEELEDAYRCYFQTKGEDGDEIFNQFAVGDQAVCQTFNAWGSRYYWRLVTGIGEDYIDLSKTDCDEDSDVPMAGDKIVQLGHRTDKTRQAAQVLSSHGNTSPSFIMYNGIDSYTLEGKEVTGILWNPATQEPQMYSYGNFFFGDRTTDENGNFISDFITFQPNPNNLDEKKLYINADVQFGSGSTGLSDLSDWKDLQSSVVETANELNEAIAEVEKIASTADAATKTLDTKISDIETGVNKTIGEINAKLDGVVENYFDDYVPTRQNEPAKTWIENGDEANHVGDTFTNTELEGDNAGKSWRWLEQEDGSYNWQLIADSDATKALLMASQAQAAADGKARNFVSQPYPPYSVGDTWMQGASGEIMRCKVARETGSYTASDWEVASKYTDDTKANEAQAAANKAKEDADAAAVEASNAIEAASNATEQAQAANTKLSNWASDSNISILELKGIKDEHAFVVADKNDILAQAAKYRLSVLLFELSCDSYIDKLSQIINAFDAATIKPDYVSIPLGLQDAQDSYYEARTTILDKIATTAKKVADDAKSVADDAKSVADDAAETAQAAKDAIDAFKEEVADDYGYLHDTFGQVTSGQVFLAKLMGVGTGTNTAINAYMDGYGLVTDTTSGKLMLATGIPATDPIYGTDLAKRAEKASTRIYEKGKIVSKDVELEGKITATSGKIGSLTVDTEGVSFSNSTNGTLKIYPSIGFSVTNSKGVLGQIGGKNSGQWVNIASQKAMQAGLGASYVKPIGVYVCMDESEEAIMCEGGFFAGLRPKTRTVSSGTTLTEFDYNVFCASGTVNLPKSPLLGQTYDIFHTSTSSITISGNGKTIYALNGTNGATSGTSFSTSQARRLHLVWGGANWYLDSNMW